MERLRYSWYRYEAVNPYDRDLRDLGFSGVGRHSREVALVSMRKEIGLPVSTTNWHLPRALRTTGQQRCFPSASLELEPHAAIAVDPQQPLREFRVEGGTLCSRESGGTGL